MRTGGCTVQQALTAEAAGVVKQAVSLARRRGNAQVTPLHVASAMLSSPAGLLRAACLRSHSHPLQCKALELCFNVALNRLPASAAAAPLLAGHHHHHHHHHHYYPPSLSNALVAAFKRAQAHQRRDSLESQQQPVLAVKIELEQLVVSILDDPSVSRVMREAGFSSTQVKANVEQAVSPVDAKPQNPNPNPTSSKLSTTATAQETKARPLDQVREEDVAAVLECLASRSKKRFVVVAECEATAEAAARAAMDRIKKGDAGEALRGLQLIALDISSFRNMPREEAERRLAELRCAVKSCAGRPGGVVLFLEDLRSVAEFWTGHAERLGRRGYYCAAEHAVMEVRTLACRGDGAGDGVWLVGAGTYQTYMRCRAGRPSLESIWGLQTLTVPTGSLSLSLNCDSALLPPNQQMKAAKRDRNGNESASYWSLLEHGGSSSRLMSCCAADCSGRPATSRSGQLRAAGDSSHCRDGSSTAVSSLPSWLQQCHHQETLQVQDLCKKWSCMCSSSSSHKMTTLNFSTVISPSSSISSYDHLHLHQPHCQVPSLLPWKAERDVGDEGVDIEAVSDGSVKGAECHSKFKELNAANLKLLCGALEKEVPWQKDIIPEIASTVLRCRSGMARRRGADVNCTGAKEETWLFFLGGDAGGKERVARELASLVFGSRSSFLLVGLGAAGSSRSDSTEEHRRNKRPRPEAGEASPHLERLYEALCDDSRRVIMVEDMDRAGRHCQLGMREAMERGAVRSAIDGGEVGLGEAIVILSCESLDSRSRAGSPPPAKQVKVKEEEEASDQCSNPCFDLNLSVESNGADQDWSSCCLDDVGLLKAVDRTLFFRLPEDL